jgi:NADH:ubiquinone oxidoreductase subunit 5 (subunit L)/multisubunit Na+/H+ antiporter MnhA subunit
MKLTLFFCAGIVHVETHTDYISEMAGIGKRMPTTMAAFAVAAAGMAGIPLVAGFVSKFYILVGTVSTGDYVFAVALLVSGVLNIAYFWPVVYQAFFQSEDAHDAKPLVEAKLGGETRSILPQTDGGKPDDEERDVEAAENAGGDVDEDDDDLDVDPEQIGQPDFSGQSVERDYSQPAPLVDGEYAVDKHPSDHTIPDEPEDEAENGHEPGHMAEDHHEAGDHDESHDHDHHGGPPAGGWERRGWLGQESTWFMLGPILAAMTGSVVLGVVPHAAVFLQLIDDIVSAVLAMGVVV